VSDIVVLIHSVSSLIGVFDQLAAQILPGVLLKHILDEPLAEYIRQNGGVTSSDSARLWDHIKIAESIRARAVLVTSVEISPLVENIRPLTALPIIIMEEVAGLPEYKKRVPAEPIPRLALEQVRKSLLDLGWG
jgi:hypothetical protein